MVKSFFNVLNREIAGLHQAAYLLGFFAICSQVLALFRDRILAAQFGAGNTLDLYYAAFRIPDILFVTVASIVSISVLIPFLIERFERDGDEARDFVDNVFSFFFCFMVFSSIIAFFLTPYLLSKIFPVFVGTGSFGELVSLSRILLLSPIFLGFSNLLASITQVHKRFFVYAMSPVVYNIGIIVGIIFLYPLFGLKGLGFGVLIGAFMHFAIQIPFIKSRGMMPGFIFPINFTIIKKIVFTSLPRTLTVSSGEITRLFLISFASFFVPGSIAVFSFSFNLQSVPLSIIGVSYSLAAFPMLTRLFSNGEKDKFLEQIITSVRHIIFWSIPITVLFIVLRAQIVRTILGAGNFDWNATRLTAAALALFVVSLVAQNLITLFVRAYYSQGKTSKPLLINVFSSVLVIFSSFYFIKLFQSNIFFSGFIESLFKVSGIQGTEVLMLPLGFSFGILINLIIYWIVFSREFKNFSMAVHKTWFHVFGSSIIMGFVTYLSLDIFDSIFNTKTLLGIFMQGFSSGIVGIIVAVIILIILKNQELGEVWGALHKKIWKVKVVVPDAELK
jgi:putative peptidoglycan lipid II flippase